MELEVTLPTSSCVFKRYAIDMTLHDDGPALSVVGGSLVDENYELSWPITTPHDLVDERHDFLWP